MKISNLDTKQTKLETLTECLKSNPRAFLTQIAVASVIALLVGDEKLLVEMADLSNLVKTGVDKPNRFPIVSDSWPLESPVRG